ncbi:DUF2797 domain-containing protein [Streptomyces abyssomicinicus]|uniref:DUF2797 domain-containing protein n=1 Tax=Streptomyces abyssomicinicus TaxID=574929 RepID=UPI00124FC117|nr:DUF2797 domain-containing protein [Streptomyces abyssomicinicus]
MTTRTWRSEGLRWTTGGPLLRWEGGRESALPQGKRVVLAVPGDAVRRCVGARGNPCPTTAAVPARSASARCEECARLERAHSVAADTRADDPQPYHVYLAWFGPGMTKVGITAVRRGPARLLEQGAVVFTWLGRGPLMAARRTEELLRAALRVPDRIPYDAKRAVRAVLPATPGERAVEVAALHSRASELTGWPEALEREPSAPVDHAAVFGLEGLPAARGTVRELVPGGVVEGRLLAAAGPDLHLDTDRGVVVLDTRLLPGWPLTAAPERGAGEPLPLRAPARGPATDQPGLF